MAPTPVNDSLVADPTSTSTPTPSPGYWTKANIIATIIFALFALVITSILIAFLIRRRMEKQSLAKPHPDKAGLLANEDKTSMFSRTRVSSVTLYVDSEADARTKQATQDAVSLIPLQVTPMEEAANPMRNTQSDGSGISAVSRMSGGTQGTVLLSPISPVYEDGDMGTRISGRSRSTSAASARYYDRTPLDAPAMPVPIIVRTASD